jgi:hypothetical protein
VVADEPDALFRVARDLGDIEIGIGLGEAEVPPLREPVAVPALVPALDQHAAEAVGFAAKSIIALGVGGGRAVLRPAVPGLLVEVHPHQMPTYFIGLTQLTSPSLLGSLRLRMICAA